MAVCLAVDDDELAPLRHLLLVAPKLIHATPPRPCLGGLSRRQVAYYASGERPVPRTVLLVCKGWEAERQDAAAEASLLWQRRNDRRLAAASARELIEQRE